MLQAKTNGLAKGIDRIGHATDRNRRQHLPADQVDIVIGAAGELRGQGVGAEKRGADVLAGQRAQLPGDAQHANLLVFVQPIARFHFQRGHPVGQQLAGALLGR